MDFLTKIGSTILPFVENLISPVAQQVGGVASGLADKYTPGLKNTLCNCESEAKEAADNYTPSCKKSEPVPIPTKYGHITHKGQKIYVPRTIKHLENNIRR